MLVNRAMMPMTAMIKFMCAGILALIMVTASPVMVKMWLAQGPSIQYSQTIPERMASDETRLATVERRLDAIESAKISERLASIEARQSIVITFLAPVALFVFTHSYETWQRLRGNRKTRTTDRRGG